MRRQAQDRRRHRQHLGPRAAGPYLQAVRRRASVGPGRDRHPASPGRAALHPHAGSGRGGGKGSGRPARRRHPSRHPRVPGAAHRRQQRAGRPGAGLEAAEATLAPGGRDLRRRGVGLGALGRLPGVEPGALVRARPRRRPARRRHPRPHLPDHGGLLRRLRLPGPGRGARCVAGAGARDGGGLSSRRPDARRSGGSQRPAAGDQHHPLRPLYRPARGVGHSGRQGAAAPRPAAHPGQAPGQGDERRAPPDRADRPDAVGAPRGSCAGAGRSDVRAGGPPRLSAGQLGCASDRSFGYGRRGRCGRRTGLQSGNPRGGRRGRGLPPVDRPAGSGRGRERAGDRRRGTQGQGRRRRGRRRADGRDPGDGLLADL
uniref:LigA n=1 Tax=Parastrongyloides trichosuri TaxID=131310 RepID=A0A0N4Z2W1_PARTI